LLDTAARRANEAEAGVRLPAGLVLREWYGMLAAGRTPQVIVAKLRFVGGSGERPLRMQKEILNVYG